MAKGNRHPPQRKQKSISDSQLSRDADSGPGRRDHRRPSGEMLGGFGAALGVGPEGKVSLRPVPMTFTWTDGQETRPERSTAGRIIGFTARRRLSPIISIVVAFCSASLSLASFSSLSHSVYYHSTCSLLPYLLSPFPREIPEKPNQSWCPESNITPSPQQQ